MTDNEIIKALECCKQDGSACRDCCFDKENECISALAMSALDLIKRQKAEIEMWKKNCDELYEQMSERLKAEKAIERRLAKAGAIKEFAERLKDTKFKHGNDYIIYAENIDNLVKEMVGE